MWRANTCYAGQGALYAGSLLQASNYRIEFPPQDLQESVSSYALSRGRDRDDHVDDLDHLSDPDDRFDDGDAFDDND